MATDTTLDARALAWEADRLAWADLDEEQRRWFVNLELFVNRELAAVAENVEHLAATDYGAELAEALDVETPESAEEAKELVDARLLLEREEGKKDALVPSRQNARTKAMRLLIEGRLDVTRRFVGGEHDGMIVAECRGDSGAVYTLGYDPHKREWRCTCEERKGNCSHLAALKLVTTIGGS